MIHLQLPDGQAFKVERKGLQLTYQRQRDQWYIATFKMYWQKWLENQVKLIK